MIKMRLCFKITMINKHMIIQAFHVFGTVTAVHDVLKIYLSMLYSKQLSTYDLKRHFTAMHNGAKAKFGIAILGFSNRGGREGNFFFKFEVCY